MSLIKTVHATNGHEVVSEVSPPYSIWCHPLEMENMFFSVDSVESSNGYFVAFWCDNFPIEVSMFEDSIDSAKTTISIGCIIDAF